MNARSSTMMHSDLAAPSYNSMMSVRPQHGPYTSLPGTPVGLDPRSMAQSDLSLAMNHARLSLETPDYFTGAPRYGGGLRPRSPYPGDYEPESGYVTSSHGSSDLNLSSLICKYVRSTEPLYSYLKVYLRRTHTKVFLLHAEPTSPLNSSMAKSATQRNTAKFSHMSVTPSNSCRDTQSSNSVPLTKPQQMCDDGRYPSDFAIPKTVETMKVLDSAFPPCPKSPTTPLTPSPRRSKTPN